MRTNVDLPRLPGTTAIFLGLALLAAGPAAAQMGPDLPVLSPLARVEQRVGVTDFAVEYSSPGVKGREIWGGLVPYGELWRTGANRSTMLEASSDFTFAGKKVPAGKYSLFTIPGESEWTVILNSEANLPGTRGYDPSNDVARATLEPTSSPMRERMTFIFSNTTDDATRLDLEWDELRLSIPIGVDTVSLVEENIRKTLDAAWRPHYASARWLLENDGDLARAMDYIDKSVEIDPTWWNVWVKAQIHAKLGNQEEALESAARAQELGEGDEIYESFFAERIRTSIESWQ